MTESAPPSKSAVKRARKQILEGGPERIRALKVISDWRSAHMPAMAQVRQAIEEVRHDFPAVFHAQRPKKLATIEDKISRFRKMDLSKMQDIVGSRLIFPDLEMMMTFRERLHLRLNSDASFRLQKQSDYIKKPKESGYRAIHDVVECLLECGGRFSVEIQYRTDVQHAWATTVETFDLITGERSKFSEANPEHLKFFKIASELLARGKETLCSCAPELGDFDLADAAGAGGKKTGILARLEDLESATLNTSLLDKSPSLQDDRFYLLEYDRETCVATVEEFPNPEAAHITLTEREERRSTSTVVLVCGTKEGLRKAFESYFTDVVPFFIYYIESLLIVRGRAIEKAKTELAEMKLKSNDRRETLIISRALTFDLELQYFSLLGSIRRLEQRMETNADAVIEAEAWLTNYREKIAQRAAGSDGSLFE